MTRNTKAIILFKYERQHVLVIESTPASDHSFLKKIVHISNLKTKLMKSLF